MERLLLKEADIQPETPAPGHCDSNGIQGYVVKTRQGEVRLLKLFCKFKFCVLRREAEQSYQERLWNRTDEGPDPRKASVYSLVVKSPCLRQQCIYYRKHKT